MNLYATVLTYAAPSANYRGESELNRTIIQKISDGRFEYPIISPEAIRNALRETLRQYGLPMNRERLHDEEQLAVKFQSLPDPDQYADDFLFGYLMAVSGKDRTKTLAEVEKAGRKESFRFKRDSVLRMNLARGLEPYRHDAVFTQSPLASEDSAYRNATSSALLHRETVVTSFQYPFALNCEDCRSHSDWAKALLRAIGELGGVAGNHARSYYEMAPASITARLTEKLVAGYETYHFKAIEPRPYDNEPHYRSTLIEELLTPESRLPANEFFIGGQLVDQLSEEDREQLTQRGAVLDRDPQRLLATVATKAFGDAS